MFEGTILSQPCQREHLPAHSLILRRLLDSNHERRQQASSRWTNGGIRI